MLAGLADISGPNLLGRVTAIGHVLVILTCITLAALFTGCGAAPNDQASSEPGEHPVIDAETSVEDTATIGLADDPPDNDSPATEIPINRAPFLLDPPLQPNATVPRIAELSQPEMAEATPRMMLSPSAGPRSIRPQPLTARSPQALMMSSDPPADAVADPVAMAAEPESTPQDSRAHRVEVFYATDRAPKSQGGGVWNQTRWLLPAGGLLVMVVFIGWALVSRYRLIYAGLAAAALAIAVFTAHGAWIKTQHENRLQKLGDRDYGGNRHEESGRAITEMGICQVSLPPDHRVGRLESPSLIKLEFSENTDRHVVLSRVQKLDANEFFEKLSGKINASSNQEAFVFVHGYNVAFNDAVKRTAQIAHDLDFDGAAICYSWPSKAMLAAYPIDEQNVRWTTLHFERFLEQVLAQTQSRQIHLIAHSMGNRALLDVIERMSLKQELEEPPFGQVILAAPDVDAGELRDRYIEPLLEVSRNVTLYASSNDRALQISTGFHGYNRAGLSGDDRLVVNGIDTIDVSPIDTSLIGHSYYGDHPLMIDDMRALIELSTPPASRIWLKPMVEISPTAYWVFRDDFVREVRLARQPD